MVFGRSAARVLASTGGRVLSEVKNEVAKPRIGDGAGLILFGVLAMFAGLFMAMVAAGGGGAGMLAFAGSLFTLGGGLIAWGVFVGLFHKIELRLIDIQNGPAPVAASLGANPPLKQSAAAEDYKG